MNALQFKNENQLGRIERLLELLVEKLAVERSAVKSHYTVEEFGGLVNRAAYTVRKWCNDRRICAEKSMTRSGSCSRWVISREEYERFQREGLRPSQRKPSKPIDEYITHRIAG